MARPSKTLPPPPDSARPVSEIVGAAAATEPLAHGGGGVVAVLRHRLPEGLPGDPGPGWVIEKRLRPGPRRSPSAELLFYSEIAPRLELAPLRLPRLLRAERGAGEERLLLQGVEGAAPRFGKTMREFGAGIAALEASSAAWFAALEPAERRRFARLAFFGPGARRGFRGHYLLYLGRLLRWRRAAPGRLSRIGRRLAALERRLRREPPCLCHLDPSSKNLIQGPEGLTLIDWGHVALGCPGFDLGAVLAHLARRWGARGYQERRGLLLAAYEARLPAAVPERLAAAREGAGFYLGCTLLFHLAQPAPIEPWRVARLIDCLEEELGLR